ncbi:hypothetical protein [Massilia sp. CT11-137]|uniref:hypothetical protein n=1 Tax=Massilia sp. CT11-137 TaxID=3393901 RepID=UPI0039A6208C
MRQTVALLGCIYDLGSERGAEAAEAWLAGNPADITRFEEEFPGARIVASVGNHHAPANGVSYCVFGGSTDFGDGWIPSACVVFAYPNGERGTALRDLPQLGTFRSAGEAQEAARKAKVVEIRADGTVVFEIERE